MQVFVNLEVMSFKKFDAGMEDAKKYFKEEYKFYSESNDGNIRLFKDNPPFFYKMSKICGNHWSVPKCLNPEFFQKYVAGLIDEGSTFGVVFLNKGDKKFEAHFFIKDDNELGFKDITLEIISALELPLEYSATDSYCAVLTNVRTLAEIEKIFLNKLGKSVKLKIVDGFSRQPKQ